MTELGQMIAMQTVCSTSSHTMLAAQTSPPACGLLPCGSCRITLPRNRDSKRSMAALVPASDVKFAILNCFLMCGSRRPRVPPPKT